MTGPSTHKNLQLVRQLLESWLDSSDTRFSSPGNELLIGMFYKDTGGDEYGPIFLDDASTDGVVDVLRNVLREASEPAPQPGAGRGRESKQMTAQSLRDQVALYARTALALLEVENDPASASTASVATAHQSTALPQELAVLVRHMAIQQLRKRSPSQKTPLLWSGSFPMPGMGNDAALEVTRDLELRVRNRVTNEVFMQTDPVPFGPLALPSKTVEEKFEAWCLSRSRNHAEPVLAGGVQPLPSEGNEA